MDYGPYLIVSIVVFGSLLAAFIGFILHCELRARNKPDRFEDYFKSLGLPPRRGGVWF